MDEILLKKLEQKLRETISNKDDIKENLLIDSETIDKIIAALYSGKSVLLTGPIGCGKTELAKENPTKSPADIEKIGEGLREPQKFSPILEPDQADRLKESAEKNGNTADEEAADIIIEGLETRISKN